MKKGKRVSFVRLVRLGRSVRLVELVRLVSLIVFVRLGVGLAVFASPFSFHGSVSIEPEYTFRQGDTLDHKPFAWNFRFQPTITVFGAPLNFNMLLSSYDVDLRQAFNRFKFILPALAMPDLRLNVPWLDLQLLDSRPNFTEFTLSGINVRGGFFDLKPGPLRASFAAGQVKRAVEGSDSTDVAYRRWLYSGRFGFGKEEKSHLYLNFLKAYDDSASIPPYLGYVVNQGQVDTVEFIQPIENSVAALNGKLSLFQDKLSFDGELAGSGYNRDSRAAPFKKDEIAWLPDFIFQPRMTTQLDWAAKLGSELSLGSTQVGFKFEQIGWGFQSVGVPFLNQDTRTLSGNFSQSFSNPFSISIDLTGELSRDNLIGMKSVTTLTQTGSITLGLYPTNVPSLTIGYVPYSGKSPKDTTNKDTTGFTTETYIISQTIFGSSGYSFNIGKLSQNLNLNISATITNDSITPANNSSSFAPSLTGNHQLTKTLSANWNFGLSLFQGSDTSTTYNGGLGSTVSLFKNRWRNSFDVYLQTKAHSPLYKFTLRLKSTVNLLKNLSLDATGQYVNYSGEKIWDEYREVLVRGGLSYQW